MRATAELGQSNDDRAEIAKTAHQVCDSWKAGMAELNLILDTLEQHEEQEFESVGWMLPRKSLS